MDMIVLQKKKKNFCLKQRSKNARFFWIKKTFDYMR